jgi:hypothetical protein
MKPTIAMKSRPVEFSRAKSLRPYKDRRQQALPIEPVPRRVGWDRSAEGILHSGGLQPAVGWSARHREPLFVGGTNGDRRDA